MHPDFRDLVYLLPILSLLGPGRTLMNGISLPRPCNWAHHVFLSALASVYWYVMWKGQPGCSQSGRGKKKHPPRGFCAHQMCELQ